MSARATWSGAITFAGFPFPIKAYNLTSSSKNESFKTLCPCHEEPIKQVNTCAADGTVVSGTERKGVERAKGVYQALDQATLDQVQNHGKSVALDVERVVPIDTLPLSLSTGAYRLIPDTTAEKPVAIMWNVLRDAKRALITRWTPRAGSRDAILAIYAGPDCLQANTLPFAHEMSAAPQTSAGSMMVAPAEVAMFEQALTTLYPNGDYVAQDFASDYATRRKAAIDAALAGTPMPAAATPAAPAVPDLMAALSASLAAAKKEPIAA
jgi:non-homologous end joining protein Ku